MWLWQENGAEDEENYKKAAERENATGEAENLLVGALCNFIPLPTGE